MAQVAKKCSFTSKCCLGFLFLLLLLYLLVFSRGGMCQHTLSLLVLGAEFRVLQMLSRHSITRTTSSALFVLVILEIESCYMHRPLWTAILFVLPHITGLICVHHCTQLLLEMEVSWTFVQTSFKLQIPLSTSQIAEITTLCHYAYPIWLFNVK
jgi:hypothetical protein